VNSLKDKGFRFLEHVADVYVEAYGSSLEEAFEHAATALFEVMTDTSKVKPEVVKRVKVTGFDEYSLLYNWLEELLYLYEVENILFSKFKVHITKVNEDFSLEGEAWGEQFDDKRHEKRTEVKAVTYSQMEILRKEGKVVVRFVLDI